MKKYITISLVLSTVLSAAFINPLAAAFKSTDNGGTLSAIDAYKDGVGAIVVGDNTDSIYNNLVFKYGEEAKINNSPLLDFVILNGTLEEINIANQIKSSSVVSLPSFNNTCAGGYGGNPYKDGSNNSWIFCNNKGLINLNGGWLNLKSVSDLYLDDNPLLSLNNLNNLESITYYFGISSTQIVNVDPLSKVSYIKELSLSQSPNLLNINGLSGLTAAESLWLQDNQKLSSLHGLENLKNITQIYLDQNILLQDISALSNVSNITNVWYSGIFFDNRPYTVKMSATSYLCNNPSKLKISNGTAITKSFVCD